MNDLVLWAKLAKGMGHNYSGAPTWPNNFLNIFPVVILGIIACTVGLTILKPSTIGEPAKKIVNRVRVSIAKISHFDHSGRKPVRHSQVHLVSKVGFLGPLSFGKEGPLYNRSQGPNNLGPTLNIFGLLFGPKLLINARTLTRKSRY